MNFSSKLKINILLVGLSGVGKTSLCQAFGNNFTEGFSYGIGLSKKAKVVELATEKGTYHVIDAPNLYDPQDESNTQRTSNEIDRILNLKSAPFVICFVICIQQHDMRVKQSDLAMIRTIKRYYNQGQVKFSIIINRLSQYEFSVFAENSQYRKDFLGSFEHGSGITISDDDILLIHDKFLYCSIQDQRELLTSYVRKFEAGHMLDFERIIKNSYEANGGSTDNPFAAFNSQKYQDDVCKILNQQAAQINSQQNDYMKIFLQAQQEQQKQSMQLYQSIMTGYNNNFFSPTESFLGTPSPSSPYTAGSTPGGSFNQNANPGANFLNQYMQQSMAPQNNYLNQFLNPNGASPYQASPTANNNSFFGGANNSANVGGYPQPQAATTNSTNEIFGAAGSFVGGALGVPSSSGDLYGAAGQFVGGAVTAGCQIM